MTTTSLIGPSGTVTGRLSFTPGDRGFDRREDASDQQIGESSAMTTDMESFEWAQGRLSGLLISLCDRLGAQSLDQLNELVDAAELPMAMELLLQALEHHEVQLSEAEYQDAAALAERMQVDPAGLVGVRRRLSSPGSLGQ